MRQREELNENKQKYRATTISNKQGVEEEKKSGTEEGKSGNLRRKGFSGVEDFSEPVSY